MALPTTDQETFETAEPIAPPTHAILHELTIAAPAPAVFDAITTHAGRAGWWAGSGAHELEVGQMCTLVVGDDEIVVSVEVADRPEVIQWICTEGPREWVDTVIGFRIEERAPGDVANPVSGNSPASILRFHHGGWLYEDGLLPRVSFEWAMLLHRLRYHLETPVAVAR